jgi:hypothetical protein
MVEVDVIALVHRMRIIPRNLVFVLSLVGCAGSVRGAHRALPPKQGVECLDSYARPIVEGSFALAGFAYIAATTNSDHIAGLKFNNKSTGPFDNTYLDWYIYAVGVAIAAVVPALFTTSSLIGVVKVRNCERARAEYANGTWVDEAAVEEQERVEAQRVIDTGKPYYCTASVQLADVCFCSHDETECGIRQRSYAELGIDTKVCQLTPVATCPQEQRR